MQALNAYRAATSKQCSTSSVSVRAQVPRRASVAVRAAGEQQVRAAAALRYRAVRKSCFAPAATASRAHSGAPPLTYETLFLPHTPPSRNSPPAAAACARPAASTSQRPPAGEWWRARQAAQGGSVCGLTWAPPMAPAFRQSRGAPAHLQVAVARATDSQKRATRFSRTR